MLNKLTLILIIAKQVSKNKRQIYFKNNYINLKHRLMKFSQSNPKKNLRNKKEKQSKEF